MVLATILLLSAPTANTSVTMDTVTLEGTESCKAPVAVGSGKMLSEFGMREDPFGPGRTFHYGVDIAAPEGTLVRSLFGGTVFYAKHDDIGGYTMIIKTKNGLTEKYAHMRKFLVKAGAVVPAGAVIGMVGSTGRTRSSHLHFAIYEKKGWNKSDHLDPRGFICNYPVFTHPHNHSH